MRAWLVIAAVGCSSPGTDVVGPFTGETLRFAIDRIELPSDGARAGALAADLDGDGDADNQLGALTAVLASTSDLSVDGLDMIASGALASTIELIADERVDDATVGARYLGAEGDASELAGGTLVDGVFRSNRVATTAVPGRAIVRLPLFTNADPVAVELATFELDLDPDGAGGFDGVVRAGIEVGVAREAAYLGLIQMFETEPTRHLVYARIIDTDRDGVLTRAEVDDSLIALLVKADLEVRGQDLLSIAFGVHLTPCPVGACITSSPVVTCRDRVRDGDETDVDCGGSCQPCWTAKACAVAADCQSNACPAGTCGAPTCSDGVRDGYESDVDCGGACPACITGARCAADDDCASGACDAAVSSVGSCL